MNYSTSRIRPLMRLRWCLVCLAVVAIAGCSSGSSERAMVPNSGAWEGKGLATPFVAGDAVKSSDNHLLQPPLDQEQKNADVALTRTVRKAVMDDKNLSVNGQSVIIFSTDGEVTLRGSVDSVAERTMIVDIATEFAGAGMVHDKMDVTQ